MKAIISDNMGMKGNVKITLLRDNIPYKIIQQHNSAKINLCEYLRDSLIGANITARRPGYITFCWKDASDELNDINQGYPLIDSTIIDVNEDDEGASCVLTFMVPSDEITEGTRVDGFRLYSKGAIAERLLYAEAFLKEPLIMSGTTNMKVDWTLTVNYVKDKEGE